MDKKGEKEEELLKDVSSAIDSKGIKHIEKIAKQHPDRMIFQKVKNPEEFKARFHALQYSMAGDYYKAIEYADKGLKINPESAYLFYIKGRSEGDVGLFAEGIKDLTEAIRLEPNYADAFVERGYIKDRMGDANGAAQDYGKALDIEPTIILPHGLRRARGVKLLYYTTPLLKLSEVDTQELANSITGILREFYFSFKSGDTRFSTVGTVGKEMTEIKIWYPETLSLISPEDSQRFYEELFDKVFDLVKEFLNSRGYKLVGYSPEIVFRIGVSEADLIPMPTISLRKRKLD